LKSDVITKTSNQQSVMKTANLLVALVLLCVCCFVSAEYTQPCLNNTGFSNQVDDFYAFVSTKLPDLDLPSKSKFLRFLCWLIEEINYNPSSNDFKKNYPIVRYFTHYNMWTTELGRYPYTTEDTYWFELLDPNAAYTFGPGQAWYTQTLTGGSLITTSFKGLGVYKNTSIPGAQGFWVNTLEVKFIGDLQVLDGTDYTKSVSISSKGLVSLDLTQEGLQLQDRDYWFIKTYIKSDVRPFIRIVKIEEQFPVLDDVAWLGLCDTVYCVNCNYTVNPVCGLPPTRRR